MPKKKKQAEQKKDIAYESWYAGLNIANSSPIIYDLWSSCYVTRNKDEKCPFPAYGLAKVAQSGMIYCNPKIHVKPKVWARAISHCVLHLAMGHFVLKENQTLWNVACDCVVERFLTEMKLGYNEFENTLPHDFTNEEALYERFMISGVPEEYAGYGTAGHGYADMIFDKPGPYSLSPEKWTKEFAIALSNAVRFAVSVASDNGGYIGRTEANRAKSWFMTSYPLLGAIASEFKIIENREVCQRMGVKIAAISCDLQEVYINPLANLGNEELRFVMAHELLHAALRHDVRHEWRDPFLWNLACDFVINYWLTEMQVGERPEGVLYDEQFKGMNAESVYDIIVNDIKSFSKLATLRGEGLGDILPGDLANKGKSGDGIDLDEFYRRALSQGLEYHKAQGRGYLPEGLVEEIRALAHPPIPWDVELARWFDEMFDPVVKNRTYARPSRRQSGTPDIPRPNWNLKQEQISKRTFGVVLDTSGSMERKMLAIALGAIASYSAARDVPAARVVFCDAAAYDQGYMKPEDIAGSVMVKGRGGTVLQPGIDLLVNAEDFAKDAPLLIITDAECEDRLMLRGREHAYLIPEGAKLPFTPKGKVFRIRDSV